MHTSIKLRRQNRVNRPCQLLGGGGGEHARPVLNRLAGKTNTYTNTHTWLSWIAQSKPNKKEATEDTLCQSLPSFVPPSLARSIAWLADRLPDAGCCCWLSGPTKTEQSNSSTHIWQPHFWLSHVHKEPTLPALKSTEGGITTTLRGESKTIKQLHNWTGT